MAMRLAGAVVGVVTQWASTQVMVLIIIRRYILADAGNFSSKGPQILHGLFYFFATKTSHIMVK